MGQYVFCDKTIYDDEHVKLMYDDLLVGIGIKNDKIIKPKIVLV